MKNYLEQKLKRYLDHLYTSMRDERRLFQAALIEFNPQALILDCGCREGTYTVELAQKSGSKQIIGLDYNFRMLGQAKTRHIDPVRSDLNHPMPIIDHSIDVVIASDILEHLVDPHVFINQTFRVLKPGGYMILDTPNLASWHNIYALLIGIQPFSGPNITTMEDSDSPLVRRMHRSTHDLPEKGEFSFNGEEELTRHIVVIAYRSLINLLKTAGFQIEKTYGFGYYPLPVFLARWFQKLDIRHTHHVLIKARKSQ